MIAYVLRTDRATYYLEETGAVVARSNGPRGWNYSGKWIILGLAKRHHSRAIVPLADAADTIVGHGIVHDLDHGTHRVWGGERGRLQRASDFDRVYGEGLRAS